MSFDTQKLKLSIHHSNFFHPKPLGVTNIAEHRDEDYLAVTKEFLDQKELCNTVTLIEIYKISSKKAANLVQTIYEYEQITGICWIGKKKILTVSRDQTINVYCVKKGLKVHSMITDYGPIRCMDILEQDNILITGTEYGYVVIYKVSRSGKTIEPLSKMVKINNCIRSLAYSIRTRETQQVLETKTPPKPGKRKRSDSSDASEEEKEEKEATETDFIESHDVIIYGASQQDVVVWDYHRKTIVETMRIGDESCQVNALLSLKSGDIVVGDSTGTLSIFDHNTFTCRQSTSILHSEILCLAKDSKEDKILVSGKDPTIIFLRRSEISADEYVLFEKEETHIHDVTSLLITKHNALFSGALDGFLVRYRLSGRSRSLQKTITLPYYTNHTILSNDELLIKYEKSLVLWKLPKSNSLEDQNGDSDQLNPIKLLLLKAKTFIHSASICDHWIAYSTRRGVHIFSRQEKKLVSYQTSKKLPNCNLLKFCPSAERLLAVSGPNLYLIELSNKGIDKEAQPKCAVINELQIGSSIQHIIHVPSSNMIAIATGPFRNNLYVYQLTNDPAQPLKKIKKINFINDEISFMTHNRFESEDSTLIYVYTNRDRLITIDLADRNGPKDAFSASDQTIQVKGLPIDSNILGMVGITSNHCILYDNHRMYKVDLSMMEVINQISNYDYIIKLDNYVFNKTDQVALVELTPEDYRKALPITQHRRKFGQ